MSKNVIESGNYNWKQAIKEQNYIDAKDETNKWCLAIVEKINTDHSVRVRYDGWSESYIKIVPFSEDHVAPLRFYTRGYTGAKKRNQRECGIYIKEVAKNTIAKLRSVIDSIDKPENLNAFDFTHFVRGELFVFIDSLLTSNFMLKESQKGEITDGEVKDIIEICDLYCTLYCSWLKSLPELFLTYMETLNLKSLYLHSSHAALACLGPEFTKTLKLLFGSSNRTKLAFTELDKRKGGKGKQINWLTNHIIKMIKDFGGFTKILNMLNKNIPIELMIEVLKPYICKNQLENDVIKGYAKDVLKGIINRIKSLESREVEMLNKMTIIKVKKMLDKFATAEITKKQYTKSCVILIQFCMQLLNCSNASTQSIGINLMSSLTTTTDNEEMILNKLSEIKFIDKILKNPNEKLLASSKNLIILLIKQSSLRNSYLMSIWNSFISSANEETSKAILNVIIPLSKTYSEDFLNMLESKSNAKGKPKVTKGKDSRKNTEEGNLQFFWRLLFEQSIPSHLKEIILESFVTLLTGHSEYKVEYIRLAGVNFLNEASAEMSIQFLLKVNFTDILKTDMEAFVLRNKLIEACIQCCMEHFEKYSKDNKKTKIISETNSKVIASANLYLEFLYDICGASEKCSLIDYQYDTLWSLYFKTSLSLEYESLLWDILKKENKRKYLGFFNNTKQMKSFFENYFLRKEKFPYERITKHAFTCFKKYFEFINSTKTSSKINTHIGLDSLWLIALMSEELAVQKIASSFIIDIYYQEIANSRRPEEIVKNFIDKILVKTYSSFKELKAALNILDRFIIKIEGNDEDNSIDEDKFYAKPLYNLRLITEDLTELPIQISQKSDTNELRKFLSTFFNVTRDRIVLYSGSINVTNEFLYLLEQYPTINVKIRKPLLEARKTPRYVLANTPEFIEKLLAMLSHTSMEIVNEVWKFLAKLPKDEHLMNRLRKLNFTKSDYYANWIDCLAIKDVTASSYVLYCLHAFYNILSSEKLQDKEYIRKLRDKQCFKFIYKLFKNNIASGYISTDIRCLYYCLNFMIALWDDKNGKESMSTPESEETMWSNIKGIIEWLITKGIDHMTSTEIYEILNSCVEFIKRLIQMNSKIVEKYIVNGLCSDLFTLGILGSDECIAKIVNKIIISIYRDIIVKSTDRDRFETELITYINELYFKKCRVSNEDYVPYLRIAKEIFTQCSYNNLNMLCFELTNCLIDYIMGTPNNPKMLSSSMELLEVLLRKKCIRSDFNGKSLFSTLFKLVTDPTSIYNSVNSSAFPLLAELAIVLHNHSSIVKSLKDFNANAGWRSEKYADWNINCDISETNTKKYVGLINMGATCYVNSVIQQLYMIPSFRNSILKLDGIPRNNALYELRHMFGALYEKRILSYKAEEFYKSMNIDVLVQRDASEFLINLFDVLLTALNNDQDSLISDLFEITTETTITCTNCNKVNSIPAKSFMLELEVTNNSKMNESLEAILKPEILEGRNAYSCEDCKTKVKAEKQEKIKSLPNVLFVHLKRFELVYGSQNKKINSFYEFPLSIDMYRFTSLKRETKEPINEVYDDYFTYNLKGVICHVGTVDAGHYYSLIRDEYRDKWVKFNDTIVTDFDINNLEEEAFGGISTESFDKSNNAYILIYQRKALLLRDITITIEKNDVDEQTLAMVRSLKDNKISKPKMSKKLVQTLEEEYKMFIEYKLAFNPAYANFVISIMDSYMREPAKTDIKLIGDFGFNFLLTVLLRSRMDEEIFKLTKIIEYYCKISVELSQDVVESFCLPGILREFLLDCPKSKARKCVLEILKISIDNVYKYESQCIKQYLINNKTAKLPSLIYLMNKVIMQFDKINRNVCGEYFGLLTKLVKLRLNKCLIDYPLLGSILKHMNLSTENIWEESTVLDLTNKTWEIHEVISVSQKCFIVHEQKLVEKNFLLQFPYMIECLTMLIKDYPESIDCMEIRVIAKEENIKKLYAISANTSMGKIAIAELMFTMYELNKGKYSEKILNYIFKNLKECISLELPAYLKTIELLLTTQHEESFKKIYKKILEDITNELKRYNYKEYFVLICYIDFILDVLRSNKRCFSHSEKNRNTMIDKMLKLLNDDTTFKEPIYLFRDISVCLNKEHSRINEIRKQANLKRIEMLQRLKKREETKVNDEDTPQSLLNIQENINIGNKVNVYREKIREWGVGQVTDICKSAVKINFGKNEEHWVELDLNHISPLIKSEENLRMNEQNLILNLYLKS